jgi:hypothetical protein
MGRWIRSGWTDDSSAAFELALDLGQLRLHAHGMRTAEAVLGPAVVSEQHHCDHSMNGHEMFPRGRPEKRKSSTTTQKTATAMGFDQRPRLHMRSLSHPVVVAPR